MKKVARNGRDADYPEFVLPRTRLLVASLFTILLAGGLALLIFTLNGED
jgi:hypothetical protein